MKYIFTLFFLTPCLFLFSQNNVLNEPINSTSKFSLSISTFNHAEQIYNGITTYELTNDSLIIRKNFLNSEKESILLTKKIDNNSLKKIKNIHLDNLKNFYFNYCTMPTSGTEYFITISTETYNNKITLHHFYEKQVERLINELNELIPDNLKLQYLTIETKQDCKM
jgi:hypothetical protein